MCLAVPGKVVEVNNDSVPRMAIVDFDGITKEICLAYLPDIEAGEYVIVHVGFAISRVDEDEALKTLELFRDLGLLEEELGADSSEVAT